MPTLPNKIATKRSHRILLGGISWTIAIVFATPILWMLLGSLRTNTDFFRSIYPLSVWSFIPREVTFENYEKLFSSDFLLSVGNSLLVTAATVGVGLAVSSMAAFALAVLRLRGMSFIFALVVLSFLVPFDATAVPLANLFRDWGLANTYIGLVLPGLANGFAIFILRQFFMNVPAELNEAARIDGLSWWSIFWRIYLPLSRPAIVGAGFTLFLFQWGAYLWPLLIGTAPDKVVGQIALSNLNTQYATEFGAIFAGAFLLTVVPLVALFFIQREFTQSLASTGSKG